jgi:signal transduction histidine kinase
VWFRKRFKIALPNGAAGDGQRSIPELVRYLEGLLAPRGAKEPLKARLDKFKMLSAARQAHDLPALYLQLEQEIVEAAASGEARAELQHVVAKQFAAVQSLPDFALVFAPPSRQELLLCRRLLAATLAHATALLGAAGNDFLGALASWVEAAPDPSAPVPFNLAAMPPRSDSEWVTLFFRFARELYLYLETKLGDARARAFYERGYNEVADRYAALETFPVLVNLLPEKLLDSEKIGRLSRSQIQKVLLQKLDEVNEINAQLRRQYDELDEARHGVVKARDELEERVAERTMELSEANELLKSEIAEREQAERGLRAAKEAADLANRAKSEFLANMSHELRTPLNAIIGFSEILKESPFGPIGQTQYEAYARDIHSSGEHLLVIINDMLDMANIEAGRIELREAPLDLRAAIDATMLLIEPRAEAGAIALQKKVSPGLPLLRADSRLVRQALMNLLSNAVKFTPADGTVGVEASVDAAGRIAIAVRDTGIGIAPEHVAKVLIPFGQVEGTLTKRHGGTGLGLPLARSFIELHGGSIALDSQLGAGTTVTILFPAERALSPARTAARLTGTNG